MLRRFTYRTAANAFIFTGLWLVIGAVALWSPLPGALGIRGELFGAWVLIFFVMLAASGSALTLAALNAAFPATGARAPGAAHRAPSLRTAAPRRKETLWAPTQPPARPSGHRER